MSGHMCVAIFCFCLAALGLYFEIEERFTNWWDRHVREMKEKSQKNED